MAVARTLGMGGTIRTGAFNPSAAEPEPIVIEMKSVRPETAARWRCGKRAGGRR
jgi:hypothetical protein